jgi:uncharacterized protein
MARMPQQVAEFLAGERIAVAGVSRDPRQVANAIYRKLRQAGHEVVPLNPGAAEVEGAPCYPTLEAVPGRVDRLMVAAHPRVGVELVRQAAARGVGQVWFHRLVGQGSVADDAVRECGARGIGCLVGGCPLMYVEPVDPFHRCARWLLGLRGRVPR